VTSDLGVWTADECALVLIDYRNEMFEVIRSETGADPVEVAHRTGIERLSHAGAVPTTALAVVTELFRDWATPLAEPALDVIYWDYTEVPKLTNGVGVAEAEKRAAVGRGAQ
jgi:hypothetical protein